MDIITIPSKWIPLRYEQKNKTAVGGLFVSDDPVRPLIYLRFPAGTTLNEAKGLLAQAKPHIEKVGIKFLNEAEKKEVGFLSSPQAHGLELSEHRRRVVESVGRVDALPSENIGKLQEQRRREALTTPKGKRSNARILPKDCYNRIKEEWEIIKDGTGTLDEKIDELHSWYELRRDRKRWPTIGPTELYRITGCASLKTASQTFRKIQSPPRISYSK